MQLDYQIVLEDIAALSLHHARTSKLSRRRMLFMQAWGIFCTLVIVMAWTRGSSVERVVFFIVLCLLWLFAYPLYYRWTIKRNVRKMYAENENKGVLGDHTIVIDPEGVTERSAVGESKTSWGGIERIQADDEHVYLYLGSLQAHVIPKRAFRSHEDAEAFVQLAQAYRLARVQ